MRRTVRPNFRFRGKLNGKPTYGLNRQPLRPGRALGDRGHHRARRAGHPADHVARFLVRDAHEAVGPAQAQAVRAGGREAVLERALHQGWRRPDRKSTRLNSSHEWISYAVFCLKKKNFIPSATPSYEDSATLSSTRMWLLVAALQLR